jgi:hypothetical protein
MPVVGLGPMEETTEDLRALQALLDRSYEVAGPHLRRVITADRRLGARALCERLVGMKLLALSTVTADHRPIVGPVDGIFYRGAFHFGSSPDSVRVAHLRARPSVSATHLPGEELSVTVHGRARQLEMGAPDHRDFRRVLLDLYTPTYGPGWEQFMDENCYWRIEAERMFTFSIG